MGMQENIKGEKLYREETLSTEKKERSWLGGLKTAQEILKEIFYIIILLLFSLKGRLKNEVVTGGK